MKITTERLVIRPFETKDAAGLWEYLAQPRMNCFMDEKLDTLEDAISEVQRRHHDETQFAVCLKDTDTLIGHVFAERDDVDNDTYGVGWHFNGKYEGKGYASEAARAFFNFLFDSKNGRRIYAYVEDYNVRSQKMCERLNMRREACFLEFVPVWRSTPYEVQRYDNTYVYAILKKEWRAQTSLNDAAIR
ncbi:GNAT family N-acetyltransferase [Dickeya oryzae]|uniref:GNAT family N-acetyltransferase n=1 Tax=Dickeya oryzae TaxID=1240404 RepID=UPI00057790BB|nr:GNAT family protein [Dickeya oryzae]